MLAAAGLYSVVSYGVATRTNEFGIRMALGAKARDVVRIVLSHGGERGAGLAAGLVLSLIFDKVAAKWVTESSRDPVILGGVTVLLVRGGIGLPVPARRAASVDPMEAFGTSNRTQKSRGRSPCRPAASIGAATARARGSSALRAERDGRFDGYGAEKNRGA